MAWTDYVAKITMDWLSELPGVSGFIETFGQTSDALSDLTAFGVSEAMVSEAQPDAYPHHLANSGMQVILGEPAPATLSAIVGGQGLVPLGSSTPMVYPGRWLQWRESGSVQAIVDACKRYGCPGAQVWSTFDLISAGWTSPVPFGNLQGFFFVVLPYPSALASTTAGEVWAGGEEWAVPNPDPVNDGDTNIWGASAATWQALQALKADIQRYKHAWSSCRFVVVANDPSFALTPNVAPGFTGNYSIYPMWEWYESVPPMSNNNFPAAFYSFSPIVR